MIQIEPTYNNRSGNIVIRYADNGSGIARENRQKIFEPGDVYEDTRVGTRLNGGPTYYL